MNGPTATPDLSSLPLNAIIGRIVDLDDKDALAELHVRRMFQCADGRRCCLSEFIADLAHQFKSPGALDGVYDLTLERFLQLPGNEDGGTDCRHYYRAVLRIIESRVSETNSPLQQEVTAVAQFRRFVLFQFKRCCLEAKRMANPAISRYAWKLNGSHLNLWLPKWLDRTKRKPWLEERFADVDPSRGGERDRIQSRIDQLLGLPVVMPLDDAFIESADASGDNGESTFAHDLAVMVADEKATNIKELRPAIKAKGAATVRRLVRDLFDALDDPSLTHTELATRYELSKATLSRFAGTDWSGDLVPDLWKNTAGVLAHHPTFREVAQSTSTWSRITLATQTFNQEEVIHEQ